MPHFFHKKYVESVSKEEKKKYKSIEFLTDVDDKEKNKFWDNAIKKMSNPKEFYVH